MRILCLLNRDLASSLALNLLLPTLHHHQVLVGLSERVGNALSKTTEHAARRELRIAEQALPNELHFPLIERAGLPDDGSRRLTFREVEKYRGIPVIPIENPNTDIGLDTVRSFSPDLIVTIRYGTILKQPVLSIPRLGVVNLHSGILPSYRGVLAAFRALINGDAEIGCTLHFISNASIDTGDIVGVRTVSVDRRRSLLWHVLALYSPGADLISDAIGSLAKGVPLIGVPQPTNGASYYSYPTDAEWANFLDQGWRIADMADLLGALGPYAGDLLTLVPRARSIDT